MEQQPPTLISLVGEANALVFENKEDIPNGLYLELMNLTGRLHSLIHKSHNDFMDLVNTMESENQNQAVMIRTMETENHVQAALIRSHRLTISKQASRIEILETAPASVVRALVVKPQVVKPKFGRICKMCAGCGERLSASDIKAVWNKDAREEWNTRTEYDFRLGIEWRCALCL
jgi:hypothetical protein